jgi:F-type H+-transporting ATPase subunit gamma
MPSLLDIRRRIRSVKNTQQLTKAMKTVSAAKLRRAQERVVSARPYAEQLRRILGNLAAKVENISHPLLVARPEERVLVVSVTADRGLCGAFNSNLTRATQNLLREQAAAAPRLYAVGRKGRDFFKCRGVVSAGEYINFFSRLDYGHAREISAQVVDLYTKAEVDAVYLVYNEFKSVIQQRVAVEKLLPLAPVEAAKPTGDANKVTRPDYIYEQPPQEVFDRLLPRYVETQVYRALLESAASEHGARMAAMDTASRNAGEMIETLTLNMNRIRQAAITREIIEVVSGAGAQ